jgi:HlyD family secretion protein
MRTWQKRVLWGAAGTAVAAAAVVAAIPKPIQVETGDVVRGPLRVDVEGQGKARVRDRFVVSAPVPGRLERIVLRAGDAVDAGAVLATVVASVPVPLDARSRAEAQARLAGALAGVGEARANHDRARVVREQARSELARFRRLFAGSAATAHDVEQAEFASRQADETLRAAEMAVESARWAAETARAAVQAGVDGPKAPVVPVRSPAAGRVLRVLVESAGPVAAGTPLLEVGDPGDLEVVVDLVTPAAARIVPGAPARLERWGGPEALLATVRRVEPSAFTKLSALGVEEQRVNVVLDPAADRVAWKPLADGFRVEASIEVWQAPDAVKVPASALFRKGTDWAVFAIVDDRASTCVVSVGERSATEVQVLSGLVPGDRVVVYPGDKLADGTRVAAR